MPTILTHAAVPLTLAAGLGLRRVPPRLLIAGLMAAVLPDLDVIGLRLGVAYAHAFGHRGATHSILAALLSGLIGTVIAPWLRASRRPAALFLAISTLSHPLLDMLTNGGLGVALCWPFLDSRYFFPIRPIVVAPLGLHRLLGPAGWRVITSEWSHVWLPAFAIALPLRAVCLLGTSLKGEPPERRSAHSSAVTP